MAYSKFSLKDIKEKFGIQIVADQHLFSNDVPSIPISTHLQTSLDEFVPLALSINTEKSRSEWIIAPILAELRRVQNNRISLFSGSPFNVDAEKGLEGQCDFIISLNSEQFYITAPVITIVVAKKENIINGLAQCISTMYAASLFNQQENNAIENVYGLVTTGTTWKFIKLQGHQAFVDLDEYYLNEIERLMGILESIVSTPQN